MFWIISFPEICNLTLKKNINFFLRKVWVVSDCVGEKFSISSLLGWLRWVYYSLSKWAWFIRNFGASEWTGKKKISSASSIDLQESLAASVTYLYLKNFKALCVILNHLIEAHISDKAFTPRFLSKVNKMKRKVTYSYEERNQSRIRESYWSGKSYLSWHKSYFDVSSLFQDLMFLRFQLVLSIIRFQMQLKLLTSARTIFV